MHRSGCRRTSRYRRSPLRSASSCEPPRRICYADAPSAARFPGRAFQRHILNQVSRMRPAENPGVEQPIDEEIDASEYGGPLAWDWHFSQRNDFQTDGEQLKVLGELQRLFEELEGYRLYRAGKWNRPVTHLDAGRKPPHAIYIWGGVGRRQSLTD